MWRRINISTIEEEMHDMPMEGERRFWPSDLSPRRKVVRFVFCALFVIYFLLSVFFYVEVGGNIGTFFWMTVHILLAFLVSGGIAAVVKDSFVGLIVTSLILYVIWGVGLYYGYYAYDRRAFKEVVYDKCTIEKQVAYSMGKSIKATALDPVHNLPDGSVEQVQSYLISNSDFPSSLNMLEWGDVLKGDRKVPFYMTCKYKIRICRTQIPECVVVNTDVCFFFRDGSVEECRTFLVGN